MSRTFIFVLERLSKALEIAIAAALAVMVVMVFGNVVLRYAFNSGITVSEEVSRWLFVWMTFLGALLALKENGHLGSDLVVSRLPAIGKRACRAVSQLLMLGVTVLLLQGSWTQARINWDVAAPVTGASMAIVYGAGVVFGALALGILFADLLRTLSGRLRDDELVMVRESEESVPAQKGGMR